MSDETIERNVKPTLTEVIDHPWLISPAGAGYTQASWAVSSVFSGNNYVSSVEVTASSTRTAKQGLEWLTAGQAAPSTFRAGNKNDINGKVYQTYDIFTVALKTGAVPPPPPDMTAEVPNPESLGTRTETTTFHAPGWYKADYRGALGTYIGAAYVEIVKTGENAWIERIYYDTEFKRPHLGFAGVRTSWDVLPTGQPSSATLDGYPKRVEYTITRAP